MKRLIVTVLASLLLVSPAFAANDKIEIVNDFGKLSYVSSRDDTFMVEREMLPGQSFSRDLDIVNKTGKDVDLYLGFTDETVSPDEKHLLDYSTISIVWDGTELYEGDLRGENLRNIDGDIINAIKLDTMTGGDTASLQATVTLDDSYNIIADDESMIRWTFYSVVESDSEEEIIVEEIPPNPYTAAKNATVYMAILFVSIFMLVFVWRKGQKESKQTK